MPYFVRVYSLQIIEYLLLPPQHPRMVQNRRTDGPRSRLGHTTTTTTRPESILRWTVRNVDVDDLLVVRHHSSARDPGQVRQAALLGAAMPLI